MESEEGSLSSSPPTMLERLTMCNLEATHVSPGHSDDLVVICELK